LKKGEVSLLGSMRRAIRRVQGTGFVQFRLPRVAVSSRLNVILFGVVLPSLCVYALYWWIVLNDMTGSSRIGIVIFFGVPLSVVGIASFLWRVPWALFGWRVTVTPDALCWRNLIRWESIARERIVGVAGATVPMFRGMFIVDQGSYLVVAVRDERTNQVDQATVTVLPIPASETWFRWHRLHVWMVGKWLARDRDWLEVRRLSSVVEDCIREQYGDKPPKRFIPFQVPAARFDPVDSALTG
jgi:hypothetical protein